MAGTHADAPHRLDGQVVDVLPNVLTPRRSDQFVVGLRVEPVTEAPAPDASGRFVTHEVPEPLPASDPPYTFVTDGFERAVQQATDAAAGKDVFLQGASMMQQALRAGLMDELIISLVRVVLGRGVRLLDGLDQGAWSSKSSGPGRPRRHASTYRVVK
jgi:dihydrofolate reductase